MEARARLAWLLWLLLLQALDAATTVLAVRAGAVELNPLVRLLLESPWALLTAKLLAGWAVWLLAGGSRAAMLLVSALYIQAVAANTLSLLKSWVVLSSMF
ncbi:hypothetical protein APE_0737 [Aeropyrum pernix ovoid virus 1]|uniref:DUF5658 domain-containing protein n=2 Tax=root TaxID=1 RepID=Q9YE32_AERPE|nr:DUF5658 family protein [Aeropyrum pernix]YP_009177671.1 DUF5658 family protein [Aeropyrum pernix ovoid virus 1]BAA79714.1 hypothetical protein APE_0737 [Aeropyrum pernix ovoid virus 1] [Aeropyrum pernix K1]CCD22161.1 TPA: hypothetical protein [Aeropyrum pernix ovoid virus 1]